MAFVIFGNASSGTSFCSYVMDDHPQIHCPFEEFTKNFDSTMDLWKRRSEEAAQHSMIYGTKVPMEEVIFRHWNWSEDQLVSIVEHYDVIFNWRPFESWLDSWNDHQTPKLDPEMGYRWWNQAWEIALVMRSRRPGGIVFNPYHRLRRHLIEQSALLYHFVGAEARPPSPDIVKEPRRP